MGKFELEKERVDGEEPDVVLESDKLGRLEAENHKSVGPSDGEIDQEDEE
jgi:hypothetical protein